MKNIIETKDLIKKYDKKTAIDNLTVAFPEGRVSGLLGPNGAGKSTLLKMFVGLAKSDSGSIKVLGGSPSWKTNAEISYLPDRAKWYQFHTVEHAIKYSSQIFPSFNVLRAKELADSMKLDLKSKVSELSRGQQACLMLLISLSRDTKLVLLDEPFSGIDLISRERIIHSIIDSLAEQKQTFVISTHEIYEAESLFEYAVFLNDGQLLKADDAESLRAQDGSIESIYRRLYR
jgi:ABC-2 type transport system ATP-binding protein